ncbi:hypothetical protein GH741_15160 [Aquibacillus halophilus]|uniref:Sporulation protein n=1 Tax=Aquibacillus halophilus TaxID=930132 RepID=A0A6A8DJP2_9BACI|nr:hypothetical protein [Aquibacillus halophilus]MRH43981.1 hypothetical protein [Aquibacillus halophilus]
MRYPTIMFLTFLLLFTTSCQQDHSEVIRDPEAPFGPEGFETTDEGFTQINQPGPRTFNRTGENLDIIKDKQMIKDAAERMPDVNVRRVTINQRDAYVTVELNQPMTDMEMEDWRTNITSAIQAVVQYYNIHVTIE